MRNSTKIQRAWLHLVLMALLAFTAEHAFAAGSRCERQFTPEALRLEVEWTPYSKAHIQVPETLKDPFVEHAIASDSFRVWALEQASAGKSPLTDYKMLADATPLYPSGTGPVLPTDANHRPIKDPAELSNAQLLKYLLDNYKLPDATVANKAKFSAKEKRARHPLLESLKRMGLIDPSADGNSEKIEGLIAVALQKIHTTWEDLLRENKTQGRDTLIPMPNAYVVAGGRFREAYFWDSFWIMKGLIESGYGSTARGMLENFVSVYERYGIIPNGNRFYYLTRTQVPVFMEMVQLLEKNGLLDFQKLASSSGARTSNGNSQSPQVIEERILNVAQSYYKSIWKGTDRFKSEFGLFTYSDGAGGAKNYDKQVIRPESAMVEPRETEKHSQRVYAESGWDFSYSRFGTEPQNWFPVDLNMMLLGYAQKLAVTLEKAGRSNDAAYFKKEASSLESHINKYLYDKTTGLYVDFNFVQKARSKVITAASFFAFYFEVYPKTDLYKQAQRNLFRTLKPHGDLGLHTTNTKGKGQWDGAWTWAPLVDIAFESLLRYGMLPEARELAFDNCLMMITTFYKNNQKFYEKYQSKDGSLTLPKDTEIYGVEEGFGWTNGAVAKQLRYLAEIGALPELEAAIRERLR
jgi:alpha,alpha-trehalase